MDKLIDSLIVAIYIFIAASGGHYTLKQAHQWIQTAALQKAAQGLSKLESSTRIMTGGKLDF